MSQKRIPIAEASEAELRQFAETVLGMSIHPGAKIETVRAKVQAAWDKAEIVLPGDEVPKAAPPGVAPRPVTDSQQPPEQGKVRIIIQRTEDAGGDQPVPVGVNGRVMLIPRGKEVDIPIPYFKVLQKAITHRFEDLGDGKGINPIPREVPLYPYQRVA
jgi:hypothetical protein